MKLLTLWMILFLSSCSLFRSKYDQVPLPENLDDAVDSYARTDENTDRDEYQHPKETLEFFGLKPTMTVVEIAPGAGYFTEILAPYLTKEGQYVMAVSRLPSRPLAIMIENEKKLQDILLRNQATQTKTKFMPFEPLDKRNKIQPAFADLVLTFNSLHNFVATNTTRMRFKYFYDVLKPGGILGIVQHRIKEGKRKVPKSGYMTESEVIAIAKKAGFKFVEKSEVNANPKDTANYPEGVWTLPPTYRMGEKDKDKYEAIGESDRMTLKFLKK